MDPANPVPLAAADWGQIYLALGCIWAFVTLMVIAGAAFMLAHAIIPSLLFTRQLHDEPRVERIFLYGISGISFVLAWYQFAQMLTVAYGVSWRIFPNIWI